MSNLMNIVNEFCESDKKMDVLMVLPSSAISEHSSVKGTPSDIEAWLTRSSEAFLASRSAAPARKKAKPMSGICGLKRGSACALLDPDTGFLKTFEDYLFQNIFTPSSVKLPNSGMIQNGLLYPLRKSAHGTRERGCGLLPTPRAEQFDSKINTYMKRKKKNKNVGGCNLLVKIKMLSIQDQADGLLNPDWTEWLMGWPTGWSSLDPLDKDGFQDWLNRSLDGTWWDEEPDISRLINKKEIKHFKERTIAIGNGIVPQCMVEAWRLLNNA